MRTPADMDGHAENGRQLQLGLQRAINSRAVGQGTSRAGKGDVDRPMMYRAVRWPPRTELIAIIDAHHDRFGVAPICRVLGDTEAGFLSTNGYSMFGRLLHDGDAAQSSLKGRGGGRRLARGHVARLRPPRPIASSHRRVTVQPRAAAVGVIVAR